jgi:integrase
MRSGKFFVDVTVNGRRKTGTRDTVEEAVALQQELKQALELGKDVNTNRVNARTWTLREALDKTLSLPAPDGWRGIAYEKQAQLNVEDACEFMGPAIKLDQINRDLIDAWCSSCEAKGNSDSTINRKVSGLSKVLKVAIAYGGLDTLPRMPKMRKEPVGRIRQLSAAEEEQLLFILKQLGAYDEADAVAVLIDTGMRCSELWALRQEDIIDDVVMIHGVEGKGTKNGEYRSVYMTSRVKAILAQHSTEPQPFPYSNTWLRHKWDRARSLMGLTDDKNFTPHVCRHTCASRLVRKGVPLPVVQKWLGHKDIKTTMRYAHMMPTDLATAAKALEEWK